MRILVYLLTLLMVFTPAYSAYASMLPTKGQIIAMGKKGGAMIKTGVGGVVKVGKVGRALTPVGAIVWCAKYKKKCDEIIDDTVEIVCDISGICTAEKPDDDQPPEQSICYTAGSGKHSSPDEACRQTYQFDPNVQFIADTSEKYIRSNPNTVGYCEGYYPGLTYKSNFSTVAKVPCDEKPQKEKRPLTDDELNDLAKKIGESMDDDDIINYYNTDYGDIIINNKRYDGDDINSQTNIDNRCNNNSCNEISQEIEQDVRSKKYDIDDVNEQNCTMSNNKYISCKKPDSDTNDDTNDDTNKQDEQEKQDEPLTCDSSKFHRKVCDWIDWTQDDLEVSDENNPKIKDLSDDLQIDKDKINFSRACPAGDNVALSLHGVHISHQISYQGLCGAFEKMRPFVIGIGGIVSVMIIGGRRA